MGGMTEPQETAPPSFGEYVRRLRRRGRHLQLRQVHQLTGISVPYLSRIENDHVRPGVETVVALHRALGGDLAMLLRLAACLPAEILDLLDTDHQPTAAAGDER